MNNRKRQINICRFYNANKQTKEIMRKWKMAFKRVHVVKKTIDLGCGLRELRWVIDEKYLKRFIHTGWKENK